MKLTQEQIEFIDSILLLNGIKYDDVKLEMMDHIASEIEGANSKPSYNVPYKSRPPCHL